MKIIAFSDIHGNQYAYDKFLKELNKINYDKLVFCGDIFGYYYGQHEIIESFQQFTDFYPVLGNHDQLAIEVADRKRYAGDLFVQYGHSYEMLQEEDIAYIKSFPICREEKWDGLRIGIMHGMPLDYLNGRLYPKDNLDFPEQYAAYDLVICGHTHFRMTRVTGSTVIINTGSLGQQRDGEGFCYAEITLPQRNVIFHNIQYDLSNLESEILKNDPYNEKLITILHRGE